MGTHFFFCFKTLLEVAGGRPPNAMQAYDQLVQALRDQQNWENRAKAAKDLLNEMLASRKEAASLRDKGYDIR